VNKRILNCAEIDTSSAIIADIPELCDYYLGGIVTKGNVKLQFQQMENHPQRLKDCESFEEIIPEDISQMVLNLTNTVKP
jgi:precorrin-2 dehydrogenase/sirohydrochlorin ferrochelatase